MIDRQFGSLHSHSIGTRETKWRCAARSAMWSFEERTSSERVSLTLPLWADIPL